MHFTALDAIATAQNLGPSKKVEKAHLLLEVLRIVLEKLSPSTVVVAEVNEPNSKLLPYLGRGKGHARREALATIGHAHVGVAPGHVRRRDLGGLAREDQFSRSPHGHPRIPQLLEARALRRRRRQRVRVAQAAAPRVRVPHH